MSAVSFIASSPFAEQESARLQDYASLLKPRVMSLVVFTSLCGLLMALKGVSLAHKIHPLLAFTGILSVAMGAGAAGCLNMWWDRDIDALMSRTQNRPLPKKIIDPDSALALGIMLSMGAVILMGVCLHWLAAGLLGITILFYVLVYTMGLKRRTPYNIVIGGAAGALPPVIGWSCVTGSTPWEAWVLFSIIFLWTPPHFWALSLYNHEDYRQAKVPMLPVVAGIKETKRQIVLYTLLLVFCSIIPSLAHMVTWVYGGIALILGGGFLKLAWRVKECDSAKPALQLFAYSIIYLFVLFSAMTLDHLYFGSIL